MSKAENAALEAYPSTPNWDERIIRMYRGGFIKGYHQAEKDLELSLEDVEIIINAFLDFCIENNERGKKKRCTDKEYGQEVLKRFKDFKERKEK